jgi:phage-related protein
MFQWTLWQVHRVVYDFMQSADEDMWAEMEARLFSLMEHGNRLGWPASEPVGNGTGLFALRAKSDTKQGRLFYFFLSGRRIVFVHSVPLKKRRTFEQQDIDLAGKRKREVEEAEDLASLATPFIVESNHETKPH